MLKFCTSEKSHLCTTDSFNSRKMKVNSEKESEDLGNRGKNEGDIDMEEGNFKGQLCLHVSTARDAGHLAC